MKEFIEKLIERLEETDINDIQMVVREVLSKYGFPYESVVQDEVWDALDELSSNKFAVSIVNQLAEEYRNDKVCQTAIMYAENLYRYGIQVDSIWETATQQSMALNQAYLRGRQDERDKFSKWREEHDNVMINAQYCWQTCSAIEHCKECNRLCNGSIDYYENYDVLAEEYINASTDTSSGWIPCSERLPDIEGNTSDTVLVCTIDGFQHMAFWCDDEKWRYCESGMIKKPMEWTEIIAWQPLPEPYKEGE